MPKPQVRIVHQGGPAALMRVYVGDEQLLSVSKVELRLDANDHGSVSARLTIHDVDLDVVADLGAIQSQTRGIAWNDDGPRTLATGGVIRTSVPGSRLIEDGGPELFVPEGATPGYIQPQDPDAP